MNRCPCFLSCLIKSLDRYRLQCIRTYARSALSPDVLKIPTISIPARGIRRQAEVPDSPDPRSRHTLPDVREHSLCAVGCDQGFWGLSDHPTGSGPLTSAPGPAGQDGWPGVVSARGAARGCPPDVPARSSSFSSFWETCSAPPGRPRSPALPCTACAHLCSSEKQTCEVLSRGVLLPA